MTERLTETDLNKIETEIDRGLISDLEDWKARALLECYREWGPMTGRKETYESGHKEGERVGERRGVQKGIADATERLDWYAHVLAFHARFGCYVGSFGPEIPDAGTAQLRASLLKEEFDETVAALHQENLPGIADGLCDLIYVAIGLAVSYGIDLRPIWTAAHAANMAKTGGATRSDGKIMKPPGWTPPPVAKLIKQQMDHGDEKRRTASTRIPRSISDDLARLRREG